MPRTAKCLCGAFSVVVSAEPMVVNVCPCRDCQRRSGVPWTSNAYFPREFVHLNGPNKIYTRTSNAGTRINHHFCPTCGVTVCWTRETGSTRFGIPVGECERGPVVDSRAGCFGKSCAARSKRTRGATDSREPSYPAVSCAGAKSGGRHDGQLRGALIRTARGARRKIHRKDGCLG